MPYPRIPNAGRYWIIRRLLKTFNRSPKRTWTCSKILRRASALGTIPPMTHTHWMWLPRCLIVKKPLRSAKQTIKKPSIIWVEREKFKREEQARFLLLIILSAHEYRPAKET